MKPDEVFDAHILLTPFAIQGYEDRHLDEEWFRGRVELFVKYCCPSVLNQTRDNFVWYLGVDKKVVSRYGSVLEQASGGRASILPVSDDGWMHSVTRAVSAFGPRLITTRLDSDDALAPSFIEVVQKSVRPRHVLNLIDGAKYEADSGRASQLKMSANPFISYFSLDGGHVIQLGGHQGVGRKAPVDNLSTNSPMWLQVIHSGNVMNSWSSVARPVRPKRRVEVGVVGKGQINDSSSVYRKHVVNWLMSVCTRVVRDPALLLEKGRAAASRRKRLGDRPR